MGVQPVGQPRDLGGGRVVQVGGRARTLQRAAGQVAALAADEVAGQAERLRGAEPGVREHLLGQPLTGPRVDVPRAGHGRDGRGADDEVERDLGELLVGGAARAPDQQVVAQADSAADAGALVGLECRAERAGARDGLRVGQQRAHGGDRRGVEVLAAQQALRDLRLRLDLVERLAQLRAGGVLGQAEQRGDAGEDGGGRLSAVALLAQRLGLLPQLLDLTAGGVALLDQPVALRLQRGDLLLERLGAALVAGQRTGFRGRLGQLFQGLRCHTHSVSSGPATMRGRASSACGDRLRGAPGRSGCVRGARGA